MKLGSNSGFVGLLLTALILGLGWALGQRLSGRVPII